MRSRTTTEGSTPTIAMVAARAGVSPMTVSRVINGNATVAEETRKRVSVIIAELGFAPNPAARALAGARRLRIGLPYVATSAFFFSEFLAGGLNGACDDVVQLVIERSDQIANQREVVSRILTKQVHGIILPPPLGENKDILKMLKDADIPFATIASSGEECGCLGIGIDDRAAAASMTRHLVELGHKRIGFIKGSSGLQASEHRLAGHLEALRAAAIDMDESLIADGDFSYRSGLDATEALLSASARPTAIFASNDDMAAAAIAVAHGSGLDIPGDLSICGFDDTGFATSVWPQLTTIRQPIQEMARAAVTALAAHLRQPSEGTAQHEVLLDALLIRRQSDAPPRRRRLPDGCDDRTPFKKY